MKYRIAHETSFKYQLPVSSSQQVLRLRPRHLPGVQHLSHHEMRLSANEAEIVERLDYFGNAVHEVRFHTKHDSLSIISRCEVEIFAKDEILLDLSPAWEDVTEILKVPANAEQWNAAQFCYDSRLVDALAARSFAEEVAEARLPVLHLAFNLTQKIYQDFAYKPGVTDTTTSVGHVLEKRSGVCQDFAHLAIATLRSLGLAARYVSGYILGTSDHTAMHLVGAQASHAWISVFCPEFGWVDFDPTNNQLTNDQHITLGWGRDYADVAPTRGYILGGGKHTLAVEVDVQPV